MGKIQHYKGLNSNLERIYETIKNTIEQEKNLKIVEEYKGFLNGVPLRSIIALNNSPKVIVGSLREIHVSVTGDPNDYAIEVASGAWFGSLLIPGVAGLLIGGPIGLAAGATVGGVMAYEFEKNMWKKITEAVKNESENDVTLDKISHFH
ncbi:MAG: hypothetical protein AB7V56_02090 [Candidatus Nitrosocosmicus sp.]|jgi:hypothetical protein|uniref:tripartite tricarboxylate transporter permease n=1 Tax=Candidatus Nitrosocosmicus agrestis TaxID=2563600 RepID=UPI00122E23CB|nr:tripartite tricarboxylate transporter permease [Candidatus Nitrosocosmicus sp. SS]KAA2279846.1 tripartite tricarboxylate transporter permease [Candidatus Nitrosocosmicus sp. SS]KAF0870374.1 tripartite tricarboxylate transporter permease [Candidatus Nitrosocosmicus sp. SS]MDR4491161.1 hypothetical protein [Candidatus Nitrosocosmicus sp.]HET6589430.1 hypothetical protein [Candidatus Nitrosocosmicus sp.]